MPPVRVAVLSQDRLYSDGLLRILGADPCFTIIGCETAALSRAAARDARPDVVLLDSRIKDALALCAALRCERGPAIIFVAAPDDEEWAVEALSVGAAGILTSGARAEDLVKAVHVVADDRQFWAPRRVLAASIAQLTVPVAERGGDGAISRRLSHRERDVFRLAASGLCNKEIAGRLAIAEATVKTHLSHIFQKLGLRGRGELAAAYHGVLPTLPPERARRAAVGRKY